MSFAKFADSASALLNSGEAHCAVCAAMFGTWCFFKNRAMKGLDEERRQWMRDNIITYADVKRMMKDGDREWNNMPNYDQHCALLTLRDIPLSEKRPEQMRKVPKGVLGWVTKAPEPAKDGSGGMTLPVVNFGPEKGTFRIPSLADVEAVQYLIDHWGWLVSDGDGPPRKTVPSDNDA